jgi:aminocarboxymuconate-semialdehyde decarboxylase
LAPIPGRIDHAWGARSDAHGDLPQPPTTYLKRVYVDTVVFTPYQLAELVPCSAPITSSWAPTIPFDMAEYDPARPHRGRRRF